MATAAVNGVTIAYDLVGSSPHTILFIHGHPFNRGMWRPQVAGLAGSAWRVLTPDLRGYGESSVVPGRTLLSTFAADLAALLDHLDIRRVVLVGLSMGGQIAMEFCRQYPQRVRGLLLTATFPQAETAEGRQLRKAMADRLLREGMKPYAAEVLGKMLAAGSITSLPAVADHVTAMMEATDPVGAAAGVRGRAERLSYEPTLAGMKIPALVVVGDQDFYTTREQADLMGSLLPDAKLLWLNGVGHMPNLEAAEVFNAALRGLLDRVVAAGDERGVSTSG